MSGILAAANGDAGGDDTLAAVGLTTSDVPSSAAVDDGSSSVSVPVLSSVDVLGVPGAAATPGSSSCCASLSRGSVAVASCVQLLLLPGSSDDDDDVVNLSRGEDDEPIKRSWTDCMISGCGSSRAAVSMMVGEYILTQAQQHLFHAMH